MSESILIIEYNQELTEMMTQLIRSEFNAGIVVAKNIEEAIDQISSHPIEVIIANFLSQDDYTDKLVNITKGKKLNIPFILISNTIENDQFSRDFLDLNPANARFTLPLDGDQFVEAVQRALKLKLHSKSEGFKRITKTALPKMAELKIPVFIRQLNGQYLPYGQASKEQKDLEFYYIRRENFKTYSDKLNKELGKRFNDTISPSEAMSLQLNSISSIFESLEFIGLTKTDIELGQKVAKSSIETLKKSKKISRLLGSLVRYNNYTYELAMMTSYLSTAMVTKTDWHTVNTLEKLSFASLLQDISLADDRLCKITDPLSASFIALADEDQRKILDHPKNSVQSLLEVEDVPDLTGEVKTLIECHHERPSGNGFPRKLDASNLSVLSCMHILAHEFSHRLLEKQITRETLEKIVVDFRDVYSIHNFKGPYESFLKVFKRPK